MARGSPAHLPLKRSGAGSVGEGRRLKPAFLRSFIAVSLLSHIGGEAAASPPILDPRPSVASTGDGLILDWHAPPPQIVPRDDGAFGVRMPGYSQIDRPGAPQLPFTAALVALPPDATPTVHVLLAEESDQPLPGP